MGADVADRYVLEYASAECVDWQPEGSYTQESEGYHYHSYTGESSHTIETVYGTAAGGVILTGTSTGLYENLTTGEMFEHTSEYNCENGHFVFSDGPSEEFWTPLAAPGSTFPDLDMIFW